MSQEQLDRSPIEDKTIEREGHQARWEHKAEDYNQNVLPALPLSWHISPSTGPKTAETVMLNEAHEENENRNRKVA